MGEPRGGDFWGAAQGNTPKSPRGRAGRTPGAPGLGCPLRRGGLGEQPRGRALPKHPPHRAGAPSGAGRAPAVGRAPPAALGAGTHTHTHKHPPQLNSISLSSSSFAPDHRQDAAFAAGDHRAPRHRAGAPLRLHHRQRKYGRSSGTGVAREGHTALFLFVAHFPAWLLAGNLCFPIAVLLAVGFGRVFLHRKLFLCLCCRM